ncbi:hypothetical protein FPCIR_2018 [Fusarium pseudocircinatum]|uniref:Transcription factor domain-containing protein n=1 Tax=Fusarium pseudocircinatum TaxID=56676 RepID=A0A8H5PTB0_9HYPO|nr:hypothetical protein FPCIR_2018 [Fusarium pseudocircinatum]
MREYRNPAYCKYELCESSETRTSTHIIRVQGSTTSYDRLYPDDSEPPTSTRPLSELGPCGWDLTEDGQAELMQDMFAYRYRTFPEEVAEERLKKTVDILLRERGCTLEDLLEDEVFVSFSLAMIDSCYPASHDAALQSYGVLEDKAASVLGRSNGVIRTQALVAVYEYGHGLYHQSHLNLSSAICMTSRIELPQSIGLELALELRLSLMLLDCMLALSTHRRDEGWLPLIWHPGHAMVRAVEDNLPTLRTPEGDSRPGETIRSALSMHQSVSIATYVLQHIHDSKRSPRSSRHECDAVYAQTLRMVEVAMNDRTTDMHHSVLLSSCLLLHHAHISITCQPWKLLEPDQWLAFHSSRESTWRLLKNVLCSYSQDKQDELHLESLISLIPSMTSLCIIANDPEGVSALEEIAAVMPYIRYAAQRWAGITTQPWHRDSEATERRRYHARVASIASKDATERCHPARDARRKPYALLQLDKMLTAARSPASCEYQHPTEPLASAVEVDNDNSQPSPADCYLFLGRCGWDLTEQGQSQLMKAMLMYDTNNSIATAGLEDSVGGVFRDRGCTPLELLEDPVFEAFFLVEHLRTAGCLHRSQFAKFSWPILHLAVLLVATPPCDHKARSQTKRLYVTVKALSALMQLHLPNHSELVQTQGLIALYECGHGMLEHAHVTLNSAFTMAARLNVDLSNILASLEWRLSLMLIDI